MAQGRRHHYIPQFLLRRFASRRREKKVWVWQYGRDDIRELSTRDVAVAKDFHGGPESELESTLSKLESEQATLLRGIDADGEIELERSRAQVAHMFVTLDTRTRALRENLGEKLHGLVEAVAHHGATDEGLRHLADGMTREYLEKELRKGLAERGYTGPAAEVQIQTLLQTPEMMVSIRETIVSDQAREFMASLLSQAQRHIKSNGIIDALHQSVIGKIIAPHDTARYYQANWHLLACDLPKLVLGDMPVVAVGADGSVGVQVKFKSEETREVYLPIDPRNAIVATFHGGLPEFSAHELSIASASLSRSAFFTSARSQEHTKLVQSIGTAEPLLNEPVDGIARDAWRRLRLE